MIEAFGLTKRYGQKTVVDGLGFTVRPGEVTGFLGPNGSGKSTTMRMILGLDRPDAGRALINGKRYQDIPRPLFEVGAMLDGRAYHPGRSAEKHLLGLARANGIPAARVKVVLEYVGLAQVAGKRAGTFSLGMGQRLGIAAALLGDPAVLLLDEPVNGLDPEGIRWIRGLVRGLAAEGRTVLLSSHLISEMQLTADSLIVIGRGRLVSRMAMSELAAQAPTEVRVRTSAPDVLARAVQRLGMQVRGREDGTLAVTGGSSEAIFSAAAGAGITLSELTPQVASLEEVYMQLTHDSVEYQAGYPGQPAGVRS